MSVDFFLHHRQHVERVSHRVEAQDHRKLLETRPSSQATVNNSLIHAKTTQHVHTVIRLSFDVKIQGLLKDFQGPS